MIFFEMMPMEGKLVVLGTLFLLWYILYKILKPKIGEKNFRHKFIILHTTLGFAVGAVVGLVISVFTGQIEVQTNYSIIFALIFTFVFFIYSKIIKEEKIIKVYTSDVEWGQTGFSTLYIVAVLMYCFIQAFKIPTGSMRMTLLEGDHLFVNKIIYGIRIPFTEKRILKLKQIKRGDIVVFSCPPSALSPEEREKKIQKDFIKRCVGLPGDVIEIRDKVLYVNNIPQNEPYVHFEDLDEETGKPKILLPSKQIYKTQQEYQKAWEKGAFAMLSPSFIRDNFGPVVVPAGCYFVLGDNRDKSFDSRSWGPLEEKYIKGAPLIIYWPPNRIRIPK